MLCVNGVPVWSVAIRGESGSYNQSALPLKPGKECSYPG